MKSFALLIITLLTLTITTAWAADSDKGQAIYEKACKTCHTPATAKLMKSPEVHNQADWEARMKVAKEESKKDPKKYPTPMDYLVQSVKNGKGAMLPGGMCQDQSTPDKKCTDADYKAAIKFMMSKEKK